MLTADELQRELSQCYGTVSYYRHQSGLSYTEGIRTLAIQGKCLWLLDGIASYQIAEPFTTDPELRAFQVWILEVEDNAGSLCCYADSPQESQPLVTQDVQYTDFVLPQIKIYVCNGVILLPSEY